MNKIYLTILMFSIFFAGCISHQKSVTPTTMETYDKKISMFEQQLNEIQSKIDKLSNQDNKSKIEPKKVEIMEQLTALSKKQEQNINYLEDIKKDITTIKTELNDSGKSVKKVKNSKSSSSTSKKSKTSSNNLSQEDMYKSCLNLYFDKSFDKASKCFDEFILKFPSSNLLSNAYFWLGESNFAQNKFIKSVNYYDIVITKYPKSEKVPAALFKEGLAFYNLQDKEGAKIFLQKVIYDYPNSEQAKYAENYLKKYGLK